VRSQGESKALGQLLNLKEALQTPGKPARDSTVLSVRPVRSIVTTGFDPAEETAAINSRRATSAQSDYSNNYWNDVDAFGRLTAEAVAAFQNANGLVVDGKVGENTLNVMVPNRVAAGRHEHAIQLVVDFHNLDVTSGTLTVHFDPALAAAGATNFESGNLRVIRVGPPAFASNATLQAAIQARLAVPAPAPT
jgi:murein L,D-transpeptidase YcbB/YkuD